MKRVAQPESKIPYQNQECGATSFAINEAQILCFAGLSGRSDGTDGPNSNRWKQVFRFFLAWKSRKLAAGIQSQWELGDGRLPGKLTSKVCAMTRKMLQWGTFCSSYASCRRSWSSTTCTDGWGTGERQHRLRVSRAAVGYHPERPQNPSAWQPVAGWSKGALGLRTLRHVTSINELTCISRKT